MRPPVAALMLAGADRLRAQRAALLKLGALEWAERFCRRNGATLEEVLGKSRHQRITAVRHDFWRLLKDTLALNFCEVARITDKDHTAVMYGIAKSAERAGVSV
mgnify:CR=1 FL=1